MKFLIFKTGNIMIIERLNTYTDEYIKNIKKIDNSIRLIIDDKPNKNRLQILKDAIIDKDTIITLVLVTDNNLNYQDFKCLCENVLCIESYNRIEVLESITGISIFSNLKKLVITDLYSNKIDLNELLSLNNLNELKLLYNNLTKSHHETLGKLKQLKKLTVKGLDPNLLACLPNLENLTCFGLKDGANLSSKMPNLKSLEIYRSQNILNLDFLLDLKNIQSLSLDGLSNVEEIPNLIHLQFLKGLSLTNMKRLKSFPIFHKGLKDLLINENIPITALDNITPDNLPNLEEINVHLGSDKKSNIVLNRFKGIIEQSKIGI